MELNLDDQLKNVQKEKTLVEIQKLESEKKKIDFELDSLKKHNKFRIWKDSISGTVKFLTALGILMFYITVFVIPTSKIENNELKLENLKEKENLINIRNRFKNDSIRFEKYKDSLIYELKKKTLYIDNITKNNDSLQKLYVKLEFGRNNKELKNLIRQKTTQVKIYRDSLTGISKNVSNVGWIWIRFSELLVNGKNWVLYVYNNNKLVMTKALENSQSIQLALAPGNYKATLELEGEVVSRSGFQVLPGYNDDTKMNLNRLHP